MPQVIIGQSDIDALAQEISEKKLDSATIYKKLNTLLSSLIKQETDALKKFAAAQARAAEMATLIDVAKAKHPEQDVSQYAVGIQELNNTTSIHLASINERLKYLTGLVELYNQKFNSSINSDEYWNNCGQEILALGEAAAKGASAINWSTDPQNGIRTWARPGLPHKIQIKPLPDEAGGMLETLTGKLSVTSTYALLYISSLLVSSGDAWIDLSDVAAKVGRDPRSSAETAQCRQEVHDTIVYGDRAIVIGERSIPYFDKTTKKTINTHIHSALWRVTDTQYPEQLSLYGGTPAKVRLVLSAQFQAILENPALRQILPFGELLGSIPGKRAAGAYARAIGLMLVNFWRRRPDYALCSKCFQTRRELLTTYPPEVAPPQEVLDGKNPKRAIEYYYGGLGILRDLGIVAPTGDANPHKDRREGLPEQEWQEKWLNAVPDIHPGSIMLPALEAITGSSYIKKPKFLGAKRGKKPKERVVTGAE